MNNISKSANIGIISLDEFKKRTIMISKAQLKPKKNDPKIWFPSIKSLANILSEENQELLRLIADIKPKSISELEPVTRKKANNLLRTLRKMEQYGLIKLEKSRDRNIRGRTPLRPKVMYDVANIKLNWH